MFRKNTINVNTLTNIRTFEIILNNILVVLEWTALPVNSRKHFKVEMILK